MTDKFNENLKKIRLASGMKQTEVAKKIGVAKNTYCNWENGTREPSILKIKALAKLFGVSVDYLVGLEENAVVYELRIKYGDEHFSAYMEALHKLTEGDKK